MYRLKNLTLHPKVELPPPKMTAHPLHPRRLISAGGIVVLVLIGVLISRHPMQINWRQVVWGLDLQLLFAVLILRWELGKAVVKCIGDKVSLTG